MKPATLAAAVFLISTAATEPAPAAGPEGSSTWKAFELGSLNGERSEDDRRYLGFLNEPAIQAGLYVLPAGATDAQPVHDDDEIYIVTGGRANLQIADDLTPAEAGSIVFVRAGVDHHFIDIEEELETLVLFSAAKSSDADPAWLATTLSEVRRAARPGENIWERFFDFESLNLGLYMLPHALGGDSALVHRVEEINFVTKGEAIFQIGEDEIRVSTGAVVWVREGAAHHFHSLTEDFDVLIMFHQKPGISTP